MSKEELQKKLNVYSIQYLISFFFLIVLIAGGAILMEREIIIWGVFLFSLAVLCFIIPFVFFIIAARKYRSLIKIAFYEEIKSKLNKQNEINNFRTEDGEEVSFDEYYFTYNSKVYKYEDYQTAIFIKNKKKLMSDEISLVMIMHSKENEVILPLDGNLIYEFKSKNLKIMNDDDLQYLLDNTALASRKLLRVASLQTAPYVLLSFVKNTKEKKMKRKTNIKIVVINAILITIMLGFYSLIIWLGETEKGLKISNTVPFILSFKILYSVIILCLTFLKSEKIKFFGKIVFICHLVSYWLGFFFLSYRKVVLLEIIFFVIFIAVGIKIQDRENRISNPINRMIGFSLFLFLVLISNTMDYKIINLGKIALLSGFIAGIISLISIVILIIYYKKSKNDSKKDKKRLLIFSIFTPFGVAIFSFMILYFSIQNLNYCLDTSESLIIIEEIIDLKKEKDSYSDTATVVIKGEKVEIPISPSQYFEFKVGDSMEISLYSGRFGFQYYVFEK